VTLVGASELGVVPSFPAGAMNGSLLPIRDASIASPPTPCSSAQSTIVPLYGLQQSEMGSHAGFNAVPYPDHRRPSVVIDSVTGTRPFAALPLLPAKLTADEPDPLSRPLSLYPTTRRFAPAFLSIALLMSCDFGNPDPYIQTARSHGRKPASSRRTWRTHRVEARAGARRTH